MDINQLNAHIIDWAKERELDIKGTVEAQAIKTVEELSELIKAICKDNKEDIIDSIGDVYVTLVIGNMLDENYNMNGLEQLFKVYFDNKGIKECKKLDKKYKLKKLGEFIPVVLDYHYSPVVVRDLTYELVKTAYSYGLDFTECVESAYNTIKDRKGKLIDGCFYKTEDLKNE